MAEYVYAIVYDDSENFAAFVKNIYGYFFSNPKNPGSGSVIPSPKGQLHGAGKFAFPGGKFESTDTDETSAAIREFHEETNYDLTSKYEKSFYLKRIAGKSTYYGVYFQVTNLSEIISAVTENLADGQKAATDIQGGKITQYEDIYTTYTKCPADNELASVSTWNLETDESKIADLNNDSDTDWFWDILDYLHDKEFNS
ncbi:MAG: NUDIX hydrolase [Acidobacteria bacterium]|nr:NUDIX hydrolase [Acidobacteriota bacterium]